MLPSQYLEKGWTQHAFARNQDGMRCDEKDADAVAWCFAGAVEKVYRDDLDTCNTIYQELENITGLGIEEYNDAPDRTQHEVVSLMKTIESSLNLS